MKNKLINYKKRFYNLMESKLGDVKKVIIVDPCKKYKGGTFS